MTLTGIHPELKSFADSWLVREPKLLLACHFAAPGEVRERFLATQILLRELFESALAVSDFRVAQARLLWWLEEASHWALCTSRHPLARAFLESEVAPDLAVLTQQLLLWLDAPSASAMPELAQRFTKLGEQFARINGDPAEAAHWASISFCVGLRMGLQATAPLASLMPLDSLARVEKTRSNWAESDFAVVKRLLADVAIAFPWPTHRATTAPMRAMLAIERRWLDAVSQGHDPQRANVRLLDAFASWRAARQ